MSDKEDLLQKCINKVELLQRRYYGFDPIIHTFSKNQLISNIDSHEYLSYFSNDKMSNEINKLFEVVNDEKYKSTYNSHRYKHIVTTIHSSKGLEYDQVIIMANDYNLTNQDDMYLHYVAVSRPKNKLLVLLENNQSGIRYRNELIEAIRKTQVLGINIKKGSLIKSLKEETLLKII